MSERDPSRGPTDPSVRPSSSDPLRPASQVDPDRASRDLLPSLAERYEPRRELGRGGMGQVMLCHDKQIGRDVAMKIIRDDVRRSDAATSRFLREARVQAQLEHPAIVPVYDVGVDATGAVFFTMKRLHGVTLSRVIRGLKAGEPEIVQAYSRRRLLTAFASLCRALEYAHSRGVLHRDIKPSNIMLGSYGEVYLLDWGIAKVLASESSDIELTGELDGLRTMHGEILGTLGYVAPEQARGRVAQLDARTDVYALGCILFEILTLRPLHDGKDRFELLHSTTRGVEPRPSVRAPERDIPPELDVICVKATHMEKTERHPSVSALREAVEGFLDGDRNMEMRRDLAREHASRAEEAMLVALGGDGSSGELSRRAALREVGRSLALDPDNEQALRVLERVFTAPPKEVPADVLAQLRAAESERYRRQIRDAITADLVGMSCALPVAVWMGVREWWMVIAVVGLTLVSLVFKLLAYRRSNEPAVETHAYFAFLFNALAVAAVARVWGPLFGVPLLLLVFANGYSATSSAPHRRRVLATAFAVQIGAVLVEILGILPRSYAFADGAFTILSRGVVHAETPTLAALTAFSLFMIFMPVRVSGRAQEMLRKAEERALVTAWQLGQLLPNRDTNRGSGGQ